MSNLKRIFYLTVTIAIMGALVTSCERDIVSGDNLITGELDKTAYVFEGLKLSNSSSKSIKEGNLVYEKDHTAFANLMSKKPQKLSINLPVSSTETILLKLEKWNIFSDDFKIVDKEGRTIENEIDGIFYHGVLKDDENSVVSASIFEDNLSIMVISTEDTYHLNREKDGQLVMKSVSSGVFDNENTFSSGINVENALNETALPGSEIQVAARSGPCTHDPIRVGYVIDKTFEDYFGGWVPAITYFVARFNDVRTIYFNAGAGTATVTSPRIPIELGPIYQRQLNVNLNFNGNILDPPMTDLRSRNEFKNGSNNWDVMGSVVAIRKNGVLVGTGAAASGDGCASGQEIPMCNKGYNNGAHPGCMPFSITALTETSPGVINENYFLYVLGHELGHAFGIPDEDNGTDDIMDLGTNSLFISHSTYVTMHNRWVSCYDCN